MQLPLLVDNAVATVQPTADAGGVRLQTVLDPGVGPVSGDPERLQQVVWNLVANGQVHAERRPGAGALERVNSRIEITVSDTGVGIRADFLPFVFERFRQGDAGMRRKAGGPGLGLVIVRHLVEIHGDTVDAATLAGIRERRSGCGCR